MNMEVEIIVLEYDSCTGTTHVEIIAHRQSENITQLRCVFR